VHEQEEGASPRQLPLSGQSLSSGCLPSLGGGGLGARRGSAHSAGSPVALHSSGGAARAFAGGGGGGGSAFTGGSVQRGRAAAAKRGPQPAQALLLDAVPAPPPQQQLPFEQVSFTLACWLATSLLRSASPCSSLCSM
jgi:hypothetical protein